MSPAHELASWPPDGPGGPGAPAGPPPRRSPPPAGGPPPGPPPPPQGGQGGGGFPPEAERPLKSASGEPVDPDEARTRVGLGVLLGVAGLLLCCLPLGLVGAWYPFSVLGQIEDIADEDARADVKRRAFIAFGVCLAAVAFSVLGYTFALVGGYLS